MCSRKVMARRISGFYSSPGSQLSELSRKKLPDPHYMLHSKAHNCNSNPTAGTQQKWFSSGFNKLHNITVKPDCGHSHNDKELR